MTTGNDDFGSALDSRMPQRKQRDKSPRTRQPRIQLANLKANLIAGLKTGNALAVQFIRGYALYSLQPDEFDPLATALAKEIDASPRLQKVAAGVGQASTHSALIIVLLNMSMRRYAIYQQVKGN